MLRMSVIGAIPSNKSDGGTHVSFSVHSYSPSAHRPNHFGPRWESCSPQLFLPSPTKLIGPCPSPYDHPEIRPKMSLNPTPLDSYREATLANPKQRERYNPLARGTVLRSAALPQQLAYHWPPCRFSFGENADPRYYEYGSRYTRSLNAETSLVPLVVKAIDDPKEQQVLARSQGVFGSGTELEWEYGRSQLAKAGRSRTMITGKCGTEGGGGFNCHCFCDTLPVSLEL